MSLVERLVERYFGVANGELLIGGIPVTGLAAEYGTPLYVYDRNVIDRKLRLLRDTLPHAFDIHYSVKANPNWAIIRHFVAAGCGLEIASAGEFFRALRAGCPVDKILFAGPGKTQRELEIVLSHGIGEIHVESLLEAARIDAICGRLGTRARVALRVNPSADLQGGAMRMGGKPAPFGIDEEKLEEALDYIVSRATLELCGIHLFAGTQILDHAVLIAQYRHGLKIARRLAARTKTPLATVDFGGGLGISYYENDRELDMASWGEALQALVANVLQEACFEGTRFIIEPGRYLVGEAGIYVVRVNDIKISRGKKFLIVDGGMNHHLAASGNLGQVIKRNFPIAPVHKLRMNPVETVDIVGPLCTPLDTLGRDVQLPSCEVGDLLGVFQSGAYGRSASPLRFLSHPVPAEVLVYDNTSHLIHHCGIETDLGVEQMATLVRAHQKESST